MSKDDITTCATGFDDHKFDVNYWRNQYRAEKKRADDNLKLLAKANARISELEKLADCHRDERDSLQNVISGALAEIQSRTGLQYDSLSGAYVGLVLRYQAAERKIAEYEKQPPMRGMP